MERRKKKKENGGFYIAVCCCAVVIAIVGYANRIPDEETQPDEKIVQKAEVLEVPENEKNAENVPETERKITEEPVSEEKDNVTVAKNVEVEEIRFCPPVGGKVTEEYSGDELVYNEALKDWRAHSGVDFEAKMNEKVLCSAKGTVLEVFDSSLGRCVIVDHKNGFTTMYANLNEDTAVKAGDEVEEGDVIGTVGETALGDSSDGPHLHFEMMKQGKNVNPAEYLE